MSGRAPFSMTALAEAFDERQLLPLRIVHLAIPLGALLLPALALAVASDPPQGSVAPGLARSLSIVTLAVTLAAWVAAFHLHGVLLGRAVAGAGSARDLLPGVQTARVVRLALLEAPALVGGVILLFAALDGSLSSEPLLLLNALPAGALAVFAGTSWPRGAALVEEIAAVDRRIATGAR